MSEGATYQVEMSPRENTASEEEAGQGDAAERVRKVYE